MFLTLIQKTISSHRHRSGGAAARDYLGSISALVKRREENYVFEYYDLEEAYDSEDSDSDLDTDDEQCQYVV